MARADSIEKTRAKNSETFRNRLQGCTELKEKISRGSSVEELSLRNWQEVVGSFIGFEFKEGHSTLQLEVYGHARKLTLDELAPDIVHTLQTCGLGTRLALLKTDTIDRPLALRLMTPPSGMTQQHQNDRSLKKE